MSRPLWPLAKDAALGWVAHKDARMGAALSYYSVFSIGPLILIAVAIAGLVSESLTGLLGENGAQAVNGMLADAGRPKEGILATLIGIATLLAAAIGVVVQLKDAFNTVWEVKESSNGGIWGFLLPMYFLWRRF